MKHFISISNEQKSNKQLIDCFFFFLEEQKKEFSIIIGVLNELTKNKSEKKRWTS